MSVEMTNGVLTANLLEGMKFALGPTMAVRRRSVEAMGGFGVLGPYCSDDFLLGEKVAAQGQTVLLSRHVIDHIILNLSFASSLRHQTRWMKSTRFSRPLGHFGTALTFSLPFGILSCLAAVALHRPILGLSLLAYSIVNRMVLAALVGSLAVQESHLLRAVVLYPLRDLLGFCCWAASYAEARSCGAEAGVIVSPAVASCIWWARRTPMARNMPSARSAIRRRAPRVSATHTAIGIPFWRRTSRAMPLSILISTRPSGVHASYASRLAGHWCLPVVQPAHRHLLPQQSQRLH